MNQKLNSEEGRIIMTDREFIESFRHYQKKGNWWCDFHPIAKLVFCLSFGFMSLIVFKWQAGLAIFILAGIIAIFTPAKKTYFITLGVMFVVGCLFTVAVRLYVHMGDPGPVAFYLFGKAVPKAAVISCLDLIFMIEGFLGIFMTFFLTTEMRDLCYSFEQIGMSPSATFMVLSTFSGIASIKEKLNSVRESQRARGIETEGSLIVKIKSILPVLFPVIISSMTGVEDRTLAMDARAFAANGKHTALRKVAPAKPVEKLIAVLALIICVAGSIAGRIYL